MVILTLDLKTLVLFFLTQPETQTLLFMELETSMTLLRSSAFENTSSEKLGIFIFLLMSLTIRIIITIFTKNTIALAVVLHLFAAVYQKYLYLNTE